MAEPPVNALDRLAFLMAFVPYLADVGTVTVAEAAKHFDMPEDFIRRSAERLTVMGIPGETRDYLPGDLFDIDWDALELHDEIVLTNRIVIDDVPRLSAREAAALLAGLQVLGTDPVIAARPEFASLASKLRAGAAGEPETPAIATSVPAAFAPLRKAIEAGVVVEFEYRNADGHVQRRRVEPLRLESQDAEHHLRGWCTLRNAMRTFRLDRMLDVTVIEDTPVTHSIDELESVGEAPTDRDLVVTIECDAAALPFLAGYAPTDISIDGGRATATIALATYATLGRLLTEIPGAVVAAPSEARRHVSAWAQDALGRYARSGE